MGFRVSCVPSVAARWFGLLEGLDVGLDDDLQAFSVGRVAEGVREPVETVSIMLLQGAEFGHSVAPALGAGAPVTGLSGVNGRIAGLEPLPVTALFLSRSEAMRGLLRSVGLDPVTPAVVPALQATSNAAPPARCSPAR